MSVVFDVSPDDMWAFQRHAILGQVATLKAVAVVSVLVGLWSGLSSDSSFLWAWLYATVYYGVVFYLLLLVARMVGKWWTRRKLEAHGAGFVGRHVLTFDGRSLVDIVDGVEHHVAVSAIHEIQETQSHVFVMVNPMVALIIPRDAVTEGDLSAMLAGVRETAGLDA